MFQPHGYCLNWLPWLLWLTVASNALIALSYYSIPITLVFLIHRKSYLEWNWTFNAFATFIFACGTTHVLDIVVIWFPVYELLAAALAVTALSSVSTAILLVYLVPSLVAALNNAGSLSGLLDHANAELERLAKPRTPPEETP